MVGVGDQVRKTKLKQDAVARQADMLEILAMVREGRLHEADGRQLETLKLALDLQKAMESSNPPAPKETTPATPAPDTSAIVDAVKAAMADLIKDIPAGSKVGMPAEDPARPKMKHTSLTDFQHKEENITVSHGDTLTQEKEGADNAEDKLSKLRKLKGNG